MRRAAAVRWAAGILVVLAGAGGAAWAQNREKAWEVTPYFGLTDFGSTGEIDQVQGVPNSHTVLEVENDNNFGFRFAYHWTKRHEIEFAFGGLGTNGTAVSDDPNRPTAGYQQDILTGRADYIFNIPLQRRDKVVAFVTAGLGILNSSTFGQSPDADMQLILESFIGDENVFMYDFGAGIRFFGSPKTGVRLDVRRVEYSSDTTGDHDLMEYTLALCLILGGA
jgi:hypothetical protein